MPDTVEDLIRQAAEKHGVPAEFALAIAEQESSFNPTAIGPVIAKGPAKGQRAIGTFQIIPTTAKQLGIDPNDPRQNIDGGVKYLRQLFDQHQGNLEAILKTYGGVVDDTSYVPGVLARVKRFKAAGGAPAPVAPPSKPAPNLPAGATAGMLPQSTAAGDPTVRQHPEAEMNQRIADLAGGVRSQLARTVYGGGDLVRRGLGMERVIDRPDVQAAMTTPDSVAGKTGQFATEVAEYLIPGKQITSALKGANVAGRLVRAGIRPARAAQAATVAEGAAQGTAAGTISAAHGEDPTAAAVVSAAMPVVGKLVTDMAPAVRRAAVTRLARFLERGAKDDLTPEVQRNVAQAASDLIDLPLQRTWRQMWQMTTKRRQAAGQDLATALNGPLGQTPVPVQPIIQALDDMVIDATHWMPAGRGQVAAHVPVPGLAKAVGELTNELKFYDTTFGGMPPAQYLHDFKQIWQKVIYPRSARVQPVTELGDLLTTVGKEARLKGTQAIMDVLQQAAPDIARLDKATAHAINLDQIVRRIAGKAQRSVLMTPTARYAVGAVGGGLGVAAGGAVGHPFIGANIGYAAARMLTRAIESPAWRLFPIQQRRRLAEAMANGNADRALRLITPLYIAATQDADNLLGADRQGAASSVSNAAR